MSVPTITLQGKNGKISAIYPLLSVDVRKEVNRIPYATLLFADGNAAKGKFDASESDEFELGAEIEVRLRIEGKSGAEEGTLFKGPVVRHGIEAGAGGSLLRIELADPAVKLTQARKRLVFIQQTDKAMIEAVAKAYDVEIKKLATADVEHKQMVQFNATGWDFILARAEANGLWVAVDGGKLWTVDPRAHQPEVHKLTYGINLYELELEADARGQYAEVKASGWSLQDQKSTAPLAANDDFPLSQGTFEREQAAKVLGGNSCLLSEQVPFAEKELQAWADARLLRSRAAFLRGRLAFPGSLKVQLLDAIEIGGVGRFAGKTLVTGLCQRIDVEGWRTDVQFGLPARSFALEEGFSDAPAGGLLPAVGGLCIGRVADFEEDPDKELRVRVVLPGFSLPDSEGEAMIWARLAAPDAGKARGWFFRPEKDDEVVVGFFNDDPRQAVILGSLFSAKNAPAAAHAELSKDNKTRSLVSKAGSAFGFVDEDEGAVFIKTAGGAKLVIDDKAKSIELADANGNTLKMDDKGITLKTGGKLTFEAGGEVLIKGSKVDVK